MSQAHHFDVAVATTTSVLYEGKAQNMLLPGEKGVFEVLVNHKSLFSRLVRGEIIVDESAIPIRRGVAKVMLNRVVAIVEEDSH